jgi:hypothetical protein
VSFHFSVPKLTETSRNFSGIVDRPVVAIVTADELFSAEPKITFLCVRHKQWKALEPTLDSQNYWLD